MCSYSRSVVYSCSDALDSSERWSRGAAAHGVGLGVLLLLLQALQHLLAVAGPTVSHDVLGAILAHLLPLLGLSQDLDQGISNLLAAVGVHQQTVVEGAHDIHWAPILGGHRGHAMRRCLHAPTTA